MGVHGWGASNPDAGSTEGATLKVKSKVAVNQSPKC